MSETLVLEDSKPLHSAGVTPQKDWSPSRFLFVLHWIFRYCVTRRGTLFYGLMFVVLSILLIAPIWTVKYLPLGDLADHAGQIRAILDFDYYKDQYQINWFTPYWVSYLTTMALAKLMPVVVAIKIVSSFCLLVFPISVALLLKQIRGDRFWVISAFPVAYCYAFFWGFYSCFVGTSVAISYMAFLVAYARRRSNYKWYLAASGFSLLLFCCHAIPWGFMALAAPLILFIHNDLKTTIKKIIPIYAIVPLVLYWMSFANIVAPARGAAAQPHDFAYFLAKITAQLDYFVDMFNKQTREGLHGLRARELFGFAVGRGPAWENVALAGYLAFWPILYTARLRFKIRRWLPLVLVVAMFMLVPYYVLGIHYIYERFAVFLIPLAYLLFDRKTRRTELRQGKVKKVFKYASIVGALACSGGLLVDNIRIFLSFRRDVQDFAAVIDHMETDKSAMFLVLAHRGGQPLAPPYLHFGGWYQAEKRGNYMYSFSLDPTWAYQPLRYNGKPWRMLDGWNPKSFDWTKHQGERYDYFVVRARSPQNELFRKSKGDIVTLAQYGSWYLYGKKKYLPSSTNTNR